MGCCCSGDTVPPVPKNMRPDPDADQPINAVAARLGYFGASRDFGIWYENRPKDSDEQKDNIWLWFNKSNVEGGKKRQVQVDLENFKRPEDGENKDKGKVLYTALFSDSPSFQVFQRWANQGFDCFYGFYKNSPPDEGDDFYVHHHTHKAKLQNARAHNGFHKMFDRCIVSKWNFTSQVIFKDGNLGRGEAYFFGQQPILEVYSKGTVVTSYYETKRVDEETKKTHFDTHRCETEFVDIVEFRLTVNGLLIAEWNVKGDSYQYGDGDINMETPLFDLRIDGGWFSRSTFNIKTKAGIDIDSALALLIAHIAATEFSVAEIKRDLKVKTPGHHPNESYDGFMRYDSMNSRYSGVNTHGRYVRGHNTNDTHNPVFQINIG